jgi:hypothetical protein
MRCGRYYVDKPTNKDVYEKIAHPRWKKVEEG